MPQTTPERAARWPGGDREAIDCLLMGGWVMGKNYVFYHPQGKVPTDRQRDASQYLIEEWDYGGMQVEPPKDYQENVANWLVACFGPMIAGDKGERAHRFLEEAVELVQAVGCTQEDAHKLVDYVYGRPVGELKQEVGGVAVTLAALCQAHEVSLTECSFDEIERCWANIGKIRKKQEGKPKFGPLAE